MEKIRLQKFISECGIMSRRAAESEIVKGNVSVNGIKASLGDKVDPQVDIVCIGTTRITADAAGSECTYIMLNKPMGYVTTLSDEKGRKTVADLINNVGKRLYPIGRLDYYSEGLLLCTNDGELTNKLTHPSHMIPKCYIATVTTHLTEDEIEFIKKPFELDGYMLKPFGLELLGYTVCGKADSTVVKFTLYEGRNREIRNICAHHGIKLASLIRISVGNLELGNLMSGSWRYLTDNEIEYLRTL